MSVIYANIEEAAARLTGVAHRTPVLTSATANRRTGSSLFFKAENFQRMGAFKFRGAYNAVSRLSNEERKGGVVAHSSGNHAQALALAARLLGVSATIVMPTDAPRVKLEATREYGATIVPYDRYTEDRDRISREVAAELGASLIPPFDHPHVIAGQGTAAKELFEETGALDILLVPLGGGGLLAGSALAAATLSPTCHVIGVEPEAGNDGQQSFRSGHIVTIPTPKTIADGAQTVHLGDLTYPIIRNLVTDIVTVTDEQLISAMAFLANRMKVIVEPTGALPVAAIFSGQIDVVGKRVGIILSGGNIDFERLSSLLAPDDATPLS